MKCHGFYTKERNKCFYVRQIGFISLLKRRHRIISLARYPANATIHVHVLFTQEVKTHSTEKMTKKKVEKSNKIGHMV